MTSFGTNFVGVSKNAINDENGNNIVEHYSPKIDDFSMKPSDEYEQICTYHNIELWKQA